MSAWDVYQRPAMADGARVHITTTNRDRFWPRPCLPFSTPDELSQGLRRRAAARLALCHHCRAKEDPGSDSRGRTALNECSRLHAAQGSTDRYGEIARLAKDGISHTTTRR